jgi:type IV pilus assembly protein PilA
MKNNTKGFTLIELLVVIAIIGILAATVLASLSSARGKANDAKVKAQLSNLRAAAESYYSTVGSYTAGADCTAGMFSASDTNAVSAGIPALVAATNYAGQTPVCLSTGSAWAVFSTLPSTTSLAWCVDSTGASKQLSSVPGAAVSVCP